MEKAGLRKLLLVVTLMAAIQGVAKSQSITATLDAPPAVRMRFADLWSVTVSNHTLERVDLELIASIRDPSGEVALIARATGPSLRGGESRRLRVGDLRSLKIVEISSGLKSAMERTGLLPDGAWRFCIEVNAPRQGESRDCRDMQLGSALPPVLLAPYDNAEVTDRQVAWSWFMQSRTTSGQEVRCNLAVVEILPGQTPEEALRVNPVLIRRKDLKGAAWQADPAIRPFRSGHRYAWRIQAVTGDSLELCTSEIWSFTYRDPADGTLRPPAPGRDYRPAQSESPIKPATIPDPPADTVDRLPRFPEPVVPHRTPSPRGTSAGGLLDDPDKPAPAPKQEVDPSSPEDMPEFPLPNDADSTDAPVDGETAAIDTDSSTRQNGSVIPLPGTPVEELPVDDQAIIGDTVPLRFSAVTRLIVERASRPGRLAETPASFIRWELAPTLRVYGMPVSISLLLSTERRPKGDGAAFNRGAFQFQRSVGDINIALAQRVRERLEGLGETAPTSDTAVVLGRILDSLAMAIQDTGFPADTVGPAAPPFMREISVDLETLQNMGIVQPTESALLDIPSLGFGVVAPEFGELLMQGVSISGGMAEYNPGIFYAGGAIGTMKREGALLPPAPSTDVDASLSTAFDQLPVARRMVYVGRVGLGRRNGTHVIASGLFARDDAASEGIARLVEELGGEFTPQKNLVAGLSGRIQDDDLRLTLDGEINESLFTDGDEGPTIDSDASNGISGIFGDGARHVGTVADLAWSGRLLWHPGDASRLAIGARYVGPGYRSVGTAGLRTDLFRLDASFDQLLLDRTIVLQGEISHEVSGAALDGGAAGAIDRIALGSDLRLPQLPQISIRYAATGQVRVIEKDSSADTVRTFHRQANATMSYTGRFGTARFGAFVSGSCQDSHSDDAAGRFGTLSLTATGRIGFGSALGAAFTYGLNTTTTGIDSAAAAVPSFGATVFVSPLEAIQAQGTVLIRELGDRRITTISAGASFDLFGLGTLDLHYDRNIVRTNEEDEHLLRATITIGGGTLRSP